MPKKPSRSVTLLIVIAISFACAQAWCQEPVKLGFAYVFSGRLAHYGFGAKQGAELAIEEINNAGGVNGRKLVALFEDTRLDPKAGVQAVQKLVKQHDVDAVLGIVSSSVASAVAPVMNDLRTPLIITLAMTPDVTGKICNPYTFRVSQNGPQNVKSAAALAADTNAIKWTTLGPDYLFGYQCWEYFQKFLSPMKPNAQFFDKSRIAYAPTVTSDFRPYIQKIIDSKPDGVLISLYGGNLVDFVHQATPMGFFEKIPVIIMNLAYSADVMYGLGLDMPKGVWLGGLYWFQGNTTPANESFVKAYMNRYRFFPDYNAEGAYSGVKTYAAAAAKAGSFDKEAVIKALEGLTLDLPTGHVIIRAEDHQAISDSVWGVSSEFNGRLRIRSLKPLKVFPGNQITPSVEETGCRHR
jgi:branched-chain amino acid transport system substrate-binding protein